MKIEHIAELLGSTAKEVAELHNLANDVTEIDGELAFTALKERLIDIEKGAKSAGKNEGRGWGEREALQRIQKRFKDELELEADDIEMAIEKVKEKIKSNKQEGKADEKLQRELETLKTKYNSLNDEYENFKGGISEKERTSSFVNRLKPLVQTHYAGSDKMIDLAIKSAMNELYYEVNSDGEIELYSDKEMTKPYKINGKHANLDMFAKHYFEELLPVKKDEKGKPPKKSSGSDSENEHNVDEDDMNKLFEMLRKAKTADEKHAIKKQIEKIEKQSKN